MKIKKWTGCKIDKPIEFRWHKLKKNEKNQKDSKREEFKMAVSKAYISCLDSEATKIFKTDMATATLNINVIKEGKELFEKYS